MASLMKEGDFARRELEKQGWRDGKGLGKDENGISTAIKVGIKNDTAGLGHNIGDQFTFHWWDHIFNKTASSIVVQESEDGVKVSKKEGTKFLPLSNKRPSKHCNKPLLYGRFVKASSDAVKPETDTDSNSDEEKDFSSQCPEDRLFQACGGRTAHKAARHGLKLNGKLRRIEEQEKQTINPPSYQSNNTVSKCVERSGLPSQGKVDKTSDETVYETSTKKKKKTKKRKHDEFEVKSEEKFKEEVSTRTESYNQAITDMWVNIDGGSKSPKKKKKKTKKKNKLSEKKMNGNKPGIGGKQELSSQLELDLMTKISVETERKRKSEQQWCSHSEDILLVDKTSEDRVYREEKKKRKKKKRKEGESVKGNNKLL